MEVGACEQPNPFKELVGQCLVLACLGLRIVLDPSPLEYEAAQGVLAVATCRGSVQKYWQLKGEFKSEVLARVLQVAREQARKSEGVI